MFQSEEENGLLKPRKLLRPGLQGGVVERYIVALPSVLFTLDVLRFQNISKSISPWVHI